MSEKRIEFNTSVVTGRNGWYTLEYVEAMHCMGFKPGERVHVTITPVQDEPEPAPDPRELGSPLEQCESIQRGLLLQIEQLKLEICELEEKNKSLERTNKWLNSPNFQSAVQHENAELKGLLAEIRSLVEDEG